MTQDFSVQGFIDTAIRRALIAAKTDRGQFETMEAALKRELATEGLAICDARLSPRSLYRHYKGGLYEVLGEARHSETEEEMVLYRPLRETGNLWVRPKTMFFETVTIDGSTRARFERVQLPNPQGDEDPDQHGEPDEAEYP